MTDPDIPEEHQKKYYSFHIKAEIWYWTRQSRDDETVIDPSVVLDLVEIRLKAMRLKDWCVGYEVSEDGYRHTHLSIEFYAPKMMITVMKQFPLQHVDGITSKNGLDNTWNYDLKDNLFRIKEKKQGYRTDLLEIKDKLDAGEDPITFDNKYWPLWCQYGKRFDEYISRKRKHDELETNPYEDCDVNEFNEPFDTALDKTPLVVRGPSGVGKTYWAQAHFKKPLIVSNIEDLRDFNPHVHDGVVFDDMNFMDMPREAQIHLLDIKIPRTIRMRHYNWTRPRGLKMIFTTNRLDIFDNHDAIRRRVRYKDVLVVWTKYPGQPRLDAGAAADYGSWT